MFGTLTAPGAPAFIGTDPANARLSDTIQQLWTSFARTGGRDLAGLPQTRKAWGSLRFDGADPGLDRLTPLQPLARLAACIVTGVCRA